ncbi:hypothetical protein TWF696_000391 [Orbilia brochopaga]|uniref:DUF7907 domain-containing protein n=1 Tax=Orbilia brochopaga TaxID=3140254 RepID=A0AAV9VEQ1_9PEZI
MLPRILLSLLCLVTLAAGNVPGATREFYLKTILRVPREYRRHFNERQLTPIVTDTFNHKRSIVMFDKNANPELLVQSIIYLDEESGQMYWQVTPGDTVAWGTRLVPPTQEGQAWAPVEIVEGDGDTGFDLGANHAGPLVNTGGSWFGFILCDWWLEKAQLFYRCVNGTNLPRGCGNVDLYSQHEIPTVETPALH